VGVETGKGQGINKSNHQTGSGYRRDALHKKTPGSEGGNEGGERATTVRNPGRRLKKLKGGGNRVKKRRKKRKDPWGKKWEGEDKKKGDRKGKNQKARGISKKNSKT